MGTLLKVGDCYSRGDGLALLIKIPEVITNRHRWAYKELWPLLVCFSISTGKLSWLLPHFSQQDLRLDAVIEKAKETSILHYSISMPPLLLYLGQLTITPADWPVSSVQQIEVGGHCLLCCYKWGCGCKDRQQSLVNRVHCYNGS